MRSIAESERDGRGGESLVLHLLSYEERKREKQTHITFSFFFYFLFAATNRRVSIQMRDAFSRRQMDADRTIDEMRKLTWNMSVFLSRPYSSES